MKPFTSPREVYSWVQKMNSSAALCLEIGQYDRAIKSLAKALQISRSYIEKSRADDEKGDQEVPMDSGCCCCHLCSLDGCIHYSEDYRRHGHIHRNLRAVQAGGRASSMITDNHREETIRKRFLQRRQERRNAKELDSEQDNSTNEFFYRSLIQVPPEPQCQSIGIQQITTLSLISIFNLAVVCHLKGIESTKKTTSNTTTADVTMSPVTQPSPSIDLHKALKLYEVAYRALDKHSGRSSSQFKLILCNNLAHVHGLNGNRRQHEVYLREVLSTTMSLIDSQRPWNGASNNGGGINDSSSGSNNNNSNANSHTKCIDLEGFLANAAPLMTEAVCADAA